ncbi:SusC/RagA family TonB-linked outer membrane protein [Sphingobacterium faecium]|uniref:SusC/RagA family TonB-linked outer membrane protein n=1 Tax=Sphingobacterium faecium TaxID=34087 RepID=UPI000B9C217E|nr:SusC/RagA family TonB-linked outer membrane protein [Sphingobacterium faecium]WGQ16446.1 SusC/RagA family TonB-linked outer membrane protein [Sphingobacterium faecium]
MKQFCITIILFTCMLGNTLLAQTKMVKGTVKGTDNKPISGVSIRLESPKRDLGKSGSDGRFVISVPVDGVMIFTYQGYGTVKTKVTAAKNEYNIEMDSKNQEIDEVVVVGYQQRKRETLTGSVVTISGKEIQDIPAGNFVDLLQGKVAGMNIQNNTGSPGMRGTIAVRGISNFNVSGSGDNAFLTPTSPLFVIDGVPIDDNSGYEYGFESAGPGVSPISMIPPEDVEDITVLKDAQATALYGSRGAYGVILVRTKRGNSKVPIVQYQGQFFLSSVPTLRKVIGGRDERMLRVEQILRNDTTLARAFQRINDSPMLADSLNPYYNNSTDWQSYFYRNTYNQTHNVNISGGERVFNYKVNMNYYDENGIIANTGFKRYTVQSNMQYEPNDRFRMMANVNANVAENQMGSGNAMMQTGVGKSVNTTSLYPAPSLFSGSMGALSALSVDDQNKTGNYVAQVELQYEPIRGLRASSTFNYNYTTSTKDRYTPELLLGNSSEVYGYYDNKSKVYNRNLLSWVKAINEKHVINLYGFTEMEISQSSADLNIIRGTANDQFQTGISYDTRRTLGGLLNNLSNYRSVAYAGNASYNYDSKYIIDLTYRLDGTSVTGGKSPWSSNPSLGFRWNFKKEKFMDKFDWWDTGFFRGSVGRTISPTGTLSDLYGWYKIDDGRYNNRPTTSLDLTNAPNTELVPQTTTQWSIGTELGFFNSALYVVYETYYKQSDKILRKKPIANHNAFGNVLTNESAMVNMGHELTINFRPRLQNREWELSGTATFAMNKDYMASLPDGARQLLEADGSGYNLPTYYRLGRNSQTFVLYDYKGVYKSDDEVPVNPLTGLRYRAGGESAEGKFFRAGDPIFTDLNGDYILDENDLVYVGNSQPKMTGGLSLFVRHKGWSLRTQFSYTLDRDILNTALADRFRNYSTPTGIYANPNDQPGAYVPLDAYNVWRELGDNADYPNVSDFTRLSLYNPYRYNSTMFLEDGSYIKFNSATLGYNFDRKWIQRFGISSARLNFTANNIYTFSHYSGPDPEIVTGVGRDGSNGYPSKRTYSLGINVQF